jgi:hypothetical protein
MDKQSLFTVIAIWSTQICTVWAECKDVTVIDVAWLDCPASDCISTAAYTGISANVSLEFSSPWPPAPAALGCLRCRFPMAPNEMFTYSPEGKAWSSCASLPFVTDSASVTKLRNCSYHLRLDDARGPRWSTTTLLLLWNSSTRQVRSVGRAAFFQTIMYAFPAATEKSLRPFQVYVHCVVFDTNFNIMLHFHLKVWSNETVQ